jgi:predicted ester cyclase
MCQYVTKTLFERTQQTKEKEMITAFAYRTRLAVVVLTCSIAAMAAPVTYADQALTPDQATENVEIATSFYSLINGGDAVAWRALFADDWTAVPPMPEAPHQIAGYENTVAALRAGIPDLTVTQTEVIANDNVVAVRSIVSGTNTASLFGQPATNAAISFTAMNIHRIADGKIVETWHVEDFLGMQSQMTGK